MKKFNSFLAIAAVALTSVFGFTSCDKADEPFGTQSEVPGIKNNDDYGTRNKTNTNDNNNSTNNNDNYNNANTNDNPNNNVTQMTTINRNIPSDAKAVKATAKDFVGTYKYTDEEGKEWTIEMTENSGNGANSYSALVTVPEGYGVDAKTYDGDYTVGTARVTFMSYETTGGKYGSISVGFGFQISQDNPNNLTVQLKLKGSMIGSPVVFAKQ